MTQLGRIILTAYSIFAVIIIMAISIRKLEKGVGKGWEAVILLPVLILLLNLS